MYFVNKIKKEFKNKEVIMFIDMDGVVADYQFDYSLDFKNKRPIMANINTFKELSCLKNIDLYILSICRTSNQIEEKNNWLNKYMPFIKNENRIILSKDKYSKYSSKEIKTNYLKNFIKENSSKTIIMIDDDNEILKYLKDNVSNIILYQDSSIID